MVADGTRGMHVVRIRAAAAAFGSRKGVTACKEGTGEGSRTGELRVLHVEGWFAHGARFFCWPRPKAQRWRSRA